MQTVWLGPELTESYAAVRGWCVQTGHGLGQKEHVVDQWVAVTAKAREHLVKTVLRK